MAYLGSSIDERPVAHSDEVSFELLPRRVRGLPTSRWSSSVTAVAYNGGRASPVS